MRSKVTIVGVGNVGASCALWLAKRGIADLVLVDIPLAKTMPVGKGLDLLQTGPIEASMSASTAMLTALTKALRNRTSLSSPAACRASRA